ncbi:MAG: signal peptide peptidase SppA [Prevotellaceae bacterium]|jgi:protease-4|nr:signal peptide peptidase SppA [Prevotellaceae bacterium]
MKQFFKFLFASMLGFILANVLIFFIFIMIIAGIAATANHEFTLKDNSVFHLKLDGEVIDRSKNDMYQEFFSSVNTSRLGLDDILLSIEKAKNNNKIKGIYLETDFSAIGISSAREIRNALIDFKKSDKFIVAYGGVYTQTAYYIASVADKIILNPHGMLEFQGLSVSPVFYKGALDKLGIEMQLVKVGSYKSAPERYTNTEMSEENRTQVTAFLSSIWNTMTAEIAATRHVSKEQLNEYADEALTFSLAEKAVANRLVDTLLYKDEVDSILAKYIGDEAKYVSLAEMKTVPNTKQDLVSDKIAVVYALGAIDAGFGGEENISSEDLAKTLLEVKDDDNVRAVVLRVNSPGGSAYGSEQIWRAVSLVREKKPVIVSMGDYAASGGYYISCAADRIVAQPTTLTGSIGIYGLIPNVQGLTDKLGITYDVVKTNDLADMPAINRPFTEREHSIMQAYVNEGYELFVKRCADGRQKTADEIKAIAEGRVWTGADAIEIGLADTLGGLSDAIRIAAETAGVEKYRTAEYPEKKEFLQELLESLNGGVQAKILQMQLGDNYKHYLMLKNAAQMNKIQAILPLDLEIK